MKAQDLLDFEARMKTERNLNRGQLCTALGVSAGKWRRMAESDDYANDTTVAYAIAAYAAGLAPHGAGNAA